MNPKIATALGLLGLVALFTLQNMTVVPVRFLFWKIEMSRALMLFVVLLMGVLVGWILAKWQQD